MLVRDPLLLIAPKRSKTEQRTLNSALKRSIDPTSARGEGEGSGRRVAIRATVLPARVSIASTIRFISVDTTVYALPLIHASRRRRRTASTSFSSPFSMSTVYVYIYMREIGEEGTSWMRFNKNLKFSGINNTITRKGK